MLKSRIKLFNGNTAIVVYLNLILFIVPTTIHFSKYQGQDVSPASIIIFSIVFLILNGIFFGLFVVLYPKWILENDRFIIKTIGLKPVIIPLDTITSSNLVCYRHLPKARFYYSFVDAVELKTSQENYIIVSNNYSNSRQLRIALSQLLLHKKDADFIIDPINDDETGEMTVLNKWGFFTSNILVFYGVFCLFMFVAVTAHVYVFFLPALLFFIFGSSVSTYLVYNDHYLQIKNNAYFWRKKTFRYEDIAMVNFPYYNKIRSITITLKDFTQVKCIIDTLGTKNVAELKVELVNKKVPVSGSY